MNSSQSKCMGRILRFIKSGYDKKNFNKNFLCLSGFAGTGKTYVIKTLIGLIRNPKFELLQSMIGVHIDKIMVTALTGKACNQYGYRGITLHKFCGLKVVNNADKTTKLVKYAYIPNDYQMVVVDEASMIDEVVYTYLMNEVRKWNFKVLFVGDSKQLLAVSNPVNVFDMYETVQLDIPERQDIDTNLFNYCNALREVVGTNKEIPDVNQYIGDGLYFYSKNRDREVLFERIQNDRKGENIKIVAFTNKKVDEITESIKNTHKDLKFTDVVCTVHKTQGSTYDYVYIYVNDIMKCADEDLRRRLLYTAFSRARKEVYIIV